jgi:hypothetical protein
MDATADRSSELDEVRQLLFPRLSSEEGWAKIDWAIRRAAEPEKQAAIEAAAERVQLRDGS